MERYIVTASIVLGLILISFIPKPNLTTESTEDKVDTSILLLGQTTEDVTYLIGKPSKSQTIEIEEVTTTYWYYISGQERVQLTFRDKVLISIITYTTTQWYKIGVHHGS